MSIPIAINARFTHRRITGVERYAGEIFRRLEPPIRSIAPARPLAQVCGHLWEQFYLPHQLKNGEVLWSPANSGPWVVRRQAVALFDASPFEHPEWFHPAFSAWYRLSWRVLVRSVSAVITPSSFSKNRLQACLPIPDARLHVIPGGVGLSFRPVDSKSQADFRSRYGLSRPYFLYVGTHEPRKNLGRLFLAWEKYRSNISDHVLLLAGEPGKVFRGKGYDQVPEGAYQLGFVPEGDLPALYSGATAVVFPSLYEGFGFPALEAMACGTPLIAASTGSIPELTGQAALLIDPLDVENITQALMQMTQDRALADEMRTRGLERASEFTWESAAARVQSLLRSI